VEEAICDRPNLTQFTVLPVGTMRGPCISSLDDGGCPVVRLVDMATIAPCKTACPGLGAIVLARASGARGEMVPHIGHDPHDGLTRIAFSLR
jgi:hypothetical protein